MINHLNPDLGVLTYDDFSVGNINKTLNLFTHLVALVSPKFSIKEFTILCVKLRMSIFRKLIVNSIDLPECDLLVILKKSYCSH